MRYRFDELRQMKLKTVELIVEERPLSKPRYSNDELVPVLVAYAETALREELRRLRARWEPQRKVWLVPYGTIRGTALEARIAASSISD